MARISDNDRGSVIANYQRGTQSSGVIFRVRIAATSFERPFANDAALLVGISGGITFYRLSIDTSAESAASHVSDRGEEPFGRSVVRLSNRPLEKPRRETLFAIRK